MSRRISVLAGILAVLAVVGSTTASRAQAVWLDDDGPRIGCRLIPGDFWPAWLCFITATHRAPAPATGPGQHAKADLLQPIGTATVRPGT